MRPSPDRALDRVTAAALVIGLALSGFFDGILLHQVLQWHHFLSLVPGAGDLRTQVFADGLFHVFVYALTLTGLGQLWRARAALDRPGARRRVLGGALLGFGLWNMIDVGLFHWILRIHRVRVAVADPMLYDLAWFAGLGLLVAAAGWLILRRPPRGGGGGRIAAATIAIALAAAMPVAQIPSPGGSSLVLFRTDMTAGQAINAVRASRSQLIAIDPAGRFAIVKLGAPHAALALYRAGALLVTSSATLAGCLAYAA